MKNGELIDFPIVGVGASAGGLKAFESFLLSFPTNMQVQISFVIIQHLAPEYKSILSEIISQYTTLKVLEVQNNMEVLPNYVYVIPPNYEMGLHNKRFTLTQPLQQHRYRLPIDFFFHSLADEIQNMAIAVVLSGSGRDGSQGIKYIKEKDGLVIAQKVQSAEFDSMPKNAILTGMVDYELTTQEMGKYIIEYIKNSIINKKFPNNKEEILLNQIFSHILKELGHDFSMYKRSTINRRVQNRMDTLKIITLKTYTEFLSKNPDEVIALFNELLIGVTSFFRDFESFNALEHKAIPKIFANSEGNLAIRVWVTACSTGEEVYSIAILFKEYMAKHNITKNIQIFASDIDAGAIANARLGIYDESTIQHISPQRLKNFFSKTANGSYKISKKIRDMIIFSEHNLIKDPPFSKLDLVCCRNLMIYMSGQLQKKLLKLFHYSLNHKGVLFLGNSESIGDLEELFTPLDKKYKIFQANINIKIAHRSIMMPEQKHLITNKEETSFSKKQELPLKELVEQAILQKISLVAILIEKNGDIVYLHGSTRKYLEIPQGKIGVNNIFSMLDESIKTEVLKGLEKVKKDKFAVNCNNLNVKIDGHYENINITISLILTKYYLIVFEQINSSNSYLNTAPKTVRLSHEEQSVDALKQELEIQERFLEDAKQRQEISNLELKSFNEEMQSLNEELQSTNEELETSREELQSVNEELLILNAELQKKINDLTRVNNDMNNLISGTTIGTIFVNHDINILRFTPEVKKIINLIEGDIGRPLRDIVTNFIDYANLIEDVQSVLDTLIPIECEVQIKNHLWFMLRIQPYRTVDNIIEGVVISFTNITDIVQIREKLKESQSKTYLAKIVYDSKDAIIMHDLDGKIIAWNPSAQKLYGWSEHEALSMNINSIIPAELLEDDLKKRLVLADSITIEPYQSKRITKDGTVVDVSITSMPIINKDSQTYAISTTERFVNIKKDSLVKK